MNSRRILVFAAALIPAAFAASAAFGEERQHQAYRLPDNAGIVDQIISVAFEPSAVFLLGEMSRGEIRQYSAAAVALPDEEQQTSAKKRSIVGAPVAIENGSSTGQSFRFSFFMAGEDGTFAATEVKRWSTDQLRNNTENISELLREISTFETKLKRKRVEYAAVEVELSEMRKDAAEISEVDEIVQLKMQLTAKQDAVKKKNEESERLRKLIEAGRQIEDPPDIDHYRLELAAALTEAAKVTAVADRLSKRQHEAARQGFLRKLELVRALDTTTPEALAKEALRLRKQRRELESRLGITSSDTHSEEF